MDQAPAMSLVQLSANFIEDNCEIFYFIELNISEDDRLAGGVTGESALIEVVVLAVPFHLIAHNVHYVILFFKLKSFFFEKSFNNANLIILQILHSIHFARPSSPNVLQINEFKIFVLNRFGYRCMVLEIVINPILGHSFNFECSPIGRVAIELTLTIAFRVEAPAHRKQTGHHDHKFQSARIHIGPAV